MPNVINKLTFEPISDAILLPGTEKIKEGRNLVLFGTTNSSHGEQTTIVKIVEPKKLILELCCASLGRTMGLPIPIPLLVQVVPSLHQGLALSKRLFAMGSIDGQYPSYGSRFRYSEVAKTALLKCHQISDCAVFDCWIGNEDRFPNNLLFDGSSNIRLIDHDDALPSYLEAHMPTKCQLIKMIATDMNEIELHRFKKKMLGFLPKINEIDFLVFKNSIPYKNIERGEIEVDRVIGLLEARLPLMNSLLSNALGIKQIDLNLESSEIITKGLAKDE
ncbi:MAG: hypothetical protein GY820_12510 [Gammaproteobacteria bacterium]|nr:hypothetical protein [Gammaproteobacteria bacterium]